ncbi:hypothetical protein [Rhodobacter ferrooxidans]|uniref:Uncharacterized protein n=1 Tax=Rhodobacter ferrooxidans TaxID=371731 RepID=C8RWL5_9RHOB|nr:hypothetical protein [Rhodobacter sp. SW2]EEW26958.1 conserved hypothetical protein [Rhodobacter sp. SW2]
MKRTLALCLVLIACGTPQENCIARNTRDLRIVDRLIAETETNLSRGYGMESVTISHQVWVDCTPRPMPPPPDGTPPPPPPRRMCWEDRDETVQRPVAIDLAAERRKLEGLKVKRRDLARQAAPVIAQCQAQYPE